MKRISLYLLLIFIIMPSLVNAQRWMRYRYEVVAGIGTVNLFGDFGGGTGTGRHNTMDFDIQGTRPALSLGVRFKLKELVSIKGQVLFAYANASDNYTDNLPRANRQGSTNTFFIEPGVQFEYSLIKERFGTRYTFSNIRRFNLSHVNTYVFVGVSGLFYFPSISIARDNDQGSPKHISMAFPMGIGFKYAINRAYTFGIELGNRITTSDYLDGHSDKYSKANDDYLILMFSISKRLRTSRRGLPRF